MNRSLNANLTKKLAFITSESNKAEVDMLNSAEGIKNKNLKGDLASAILKIASDANAVENLVYAEMYLQTLDLESATTEKDKADIKNTQIGYKQILETIEQMRNSPAEYFRANRSIKETRGDFKKMPKSRAISQIDDNIARLQSRDSFSDEHKHQVWSARITMAGKTKSMLKALHDTLAADFPGE